MHGELNKVYTIEGSENSTIDITRAFKFAKEAALKDKQPKKIYLNSNPVYLIDRKGNLAVV